jgi:hypothetical protein
MIITTIVIYECVQTEQTSPESDRILLVRVWVPLDQ